MSLTLTLALVGNLSGPLLVETGSPDALCPDLSQTRKAVSDRLGTLRVRRPGWRAIYTIGHAPGSTKGDFVNLVLRDPDGNLMLQRELPLAGESCLTMAHAIALILERYFANLSDDSPEAKPTAPTPSAPANEGGVAADRTSCRGPTGEQNSACRDRRSDRFDSAPARSEPAAGGTKIAGHGSQAAPAKSSRTQGNGSQPGLAIGLGGAIARPPAAGALSVTASLGIGPGLEAGLLGLYPFGEREESVPPAVVRLRSVPVRLWLEMSGRDGAVSWRVGPELLLSIERAHGEGLVHAKLRHRVVPGIGGGAGATVWLQPAWGLGVAAGLDWAQPSLSSEFVIDDREVLSSDAVHAYGCLGVNFEIWP